MKKLLEFPLSFSGVRWRVEVDKVTIRSLFKLLIYSVHIKHKSKQQSITGMESTCSGDHVNEKKRNQKVVPRHILEPLSELLRHTKYTAQKKLLAGKLHTNFNLIFYVALSMPNV